ncbi:flagellar protein FlgN [Cohnella massiliensis]|uniref:flagellar protein FlgN n=1 Tax=Cohnella massiliensis TaxID=1816691 RepID=UPI001119F985|nr:flagellar protein FlgN [Cohnella massiliensis]
MALNPLYETMETLLEQHERMLELSEQKKQAIIRNEVNRLTEITTKESRLLKLISDTERQRRQNVEEYYLSKGLKPNPEATVSGIVQLETNPREKTKLANLGERLVESVNRLKQLNELNMQLLKQAIEFNDFSLDLLSGSDEQDMIYKPPANQTGYGGGARLFDSRA